MTTTNNLGLPTESDEKKLLQLLNNERATLKEVKKVLPDYKYIIFQGAVYSMNDFMMHPGGYYLISGALGREVDCFLFGGYALETSDVAPYAHSQFAYNLLSTMYLGPLDIPLAENPLKEIQNQQTGNLPRELWKVQNEHKLSRSTSKFEFSCPYYKIANFMPGVQWIGRHFTLTSLKTRKARLYTTVVCMTHTSIEARQKLVDYVFAGCVGDEDLVFKVPQQRFYSDTLPLIVKKYNSSGALSLELHNKVTEEYELSGPHGLGLLLKPEAKGTHLIFAGGTGILPFLDLFNFLIKKTAHQIVKKQKGISIDFANQGVEESFNDDTFCIRLYAAFADSTELVGEDLIRTLQKLSALASEIQKPQKAGPPIFSATMRFASKEAIIGIPITSSRFDEKFIQNEMQSWGELSRVFICGPPAMNRAVPAALKALAVDPDIIHYV